MAEKLVEQAWFPGVWPANNRGPYAAPQDLPLVGGAQQFVHEIDTGLKPADELVASIGGNVFIGKIDVRLDVREDLEHLLAQGLDALGELACELLAGGAQG